eukprot:CAMPEP_0197911254 /NCGR_PEP_ID=MMETSP1439-20131203/72508_1 /TAXON_ID=66791 /ORGANISM="Gonyaulax spinifera, Strain CCMP409" /LENGTH=74 /DNA_ID=CAMNT_0043532979 /DNA_START=111 /DNA_END=335 /DNA_ORIENTATION=+
MGNSGAKNQEATEKAPEQAPQQSGITVRPKEDTGSTEQRRPSLSSRGSVVTAASSKGAIHTRPKVPKSMRVSQR